MQNDFNELLRRLCSMKKDMTGSKPLLCENCNAREELCNESCSVRN